MSFFDKMIEVAKSMGVKDFGFYKKWALDHLKKQLKEEDTVTKALEYCEEYMEKAYGVGTIRTWKGKKYIKGADKKWRRYFDKHDRGANQAIKNIMREINSLKNGDVEGLYAIIQKNAGRFRDENGNVLPEVQQIHNLVEKKQGGSEFKNINDINSPDFKKKFRESYLKTLKEVKNYSDEKLKKELKELERNIEKFNDQPEYAEKKGMYQALLEETSDRANTEEKKEKELSPLQKYENSIRDEKYEQARKDAEMRNQNEKKEEIIDGPYGRKYTVGEAKKEIEGQIRYLQGMKEMIGKQPKGSLAKDTENFIENLMGKLKPEDRKDLEVMYDIYKNGGKEKDTHYWIQDSKGNRLTNIDAKKRIKGNLEQIQAFNELMEGRSKAENARTEIAKRSLEVDNNRLMERLNADDRKEMKSEFEKRKSSIKKSFLEQIEEISKSVKSGQKHDLEYYKKWALSILDKQEETVDEPNEDTVVKALEYCETMMKSGYPVGTIREWKGQKYIKIAPNKWKPKYDNMGSRGAKMSLTNLKKAVAKCNSEEELFNLINSNASRFRDENGNPFPEVQELHDMVNKRSNEIKGKKNAETLDKVQKLGKKAENTTDKLGNGNVEGVAEDAGDDTVNAIKNGSKKKQQNENNVEEDETKSDKDIEKMEALNEDIKNGGIVSTEIKEEKKPVAAQNVLTPSDLEGDSENETFESLTEKYNATKDPDEREKILNKITALEKEKSDTIKDMKEKRKEDLTKKYSETTDPDEREKILNEMMNLDRQDEEKILPAMFDKEDEGFDAWDKDQKAKYGDKSVEELQKLLDTKYKNVKKYTPEYSEAMKIGDMIQQKKRQKK